MIYFLKCEDYVKIGFSKNIEKRFYQTKYDIPFDIEIINTIEGDEFIERDFQYHYKHLHHRGEWFKYDDTMRTIKEVPENEMKVKKIRTYIRHTKTEDLLKEYCEKQIFIHPELFTKEGWRSLDKSTIKKYNKNLSGCSSYATYLNILRTKGIILQDYKTYKIMELTGLDSPTIRNYKKLLEKNWPFWEKMT